jgi:hypothetical protein
MIGTKNDTATSALASVCITDAENEIKKRLAKRYDFSGSPFDTTTTIPPIITTLTETLAIGYMYENMARGSKEGHARADRYIKRVMDNITELLEGDAQLMDASGELIAETEGEWSVFNSTEGYSPTFNEDDPENWTPDQEKLDDIADERS